MNTLQEIPLSEADRNGGGFSSETMDGSLLLESGQCHVRDEVAHEKAVLRLTEFMEDKRQPMSRRRREFDRILYEAADTDDFPLIMGDTVNRSLQAAYAAGTAPIKQIAMSRTTSDLKGIKVFNITGQTAPLQVVPAGGEYQDSLLTEGKVLYYPKKYGRAYSVNWELVINDDLGILDRVFPNFATAVMNTESYNISSLMATAAGPIAANFAGGVDTPVLALAGLATGISAMLTQTIDAPTTHPIMSTPRYLVVPPQLYITATNLVRSDLQMTVLTGDADVAAYAVPTTNAAIKDFNLQVIVNPWLPILDTTTGDTAWYLFTDPSDIPWCEFAELRGHIGPELFMKASNMARAGGGAVSPLEGDFETDGVGFKVRNVHGFSASDNMGGYASDGTV